MCRQVRKTGRREIKARADIKRMFTKPCKTTLTSTEEWRSGVAGRAMPMAYNVRTALRKLPWTRSSACGKARRIRLKRPWK